MNTLNYNSLSEALNASDQQYLVINHPVTHKPIKIKIATFIDMFGADLIISADNGLSIVGNNTELGGTLTKNTNIDFDTFDLSFTNVSNGTGTEDRLVIDGLGNIKKLAVTSVGLWALSGNAGLTAGTHFLGTTDDIDVVFKRNSIEKLRILTSSVTIVDNVGIGGPTIDARLHVKGEGGATYAFKVDDSSNTGLLNITNAGKINIGGGAAIGSTFSVRQNGGTRAFDVYNTAASKQLILVEDDGATTGFVRIADGTLEANTYTHNVGIGVSPGLSKLRVKGDSAGQDVFNITPSAGTGGVLISDASNHPFFYMQNASAATKIQFHTNGDSYINGGKVSMTALPTSNAGLSTGDLYVDTAANILANGDKVVGWKV